jgi:hypothetical protein
MHKAMPELRNITGDEKLARWMGLKALGQSVTNFTGWWMHAFECLSRTIEKEKNLRIEIIHRMIVGCGISFMPPLIVIDIFVRTSMQSTVVRVLEPRRCRLGVVATT